MSSSSRPNGGVTSLKIKCTSIGRTSVDGGTGGTADDVQPLVIDVPVKLTQRTRLHADVGGGELFAGLHRVIRSENGIHEDADVQGS